MTPAQLQSCFPLIGAARAAVFAPYLDAAMAEYGIDTPIRQAYFLAQLGHESGQLRYLSEFANGQAYNTRADLGNTRPEAIRIAAAHNARPGPWWKGHGGFQVTGYDNHLACGKALGLDLLNNPTLICAPKDACRSAAWFWQTHNLNRWADAGDFDGCSDVVNIGHKTKAVGDSNGYQDRLALCQSLRKVLKC